MTYQFTTEVDSLIAGDRTIHLSEFTPRGIAYMLQYGLNKARQDSVSGQAKVLGEAHKALIEGTNTKDDDKVLDKAGKDIEASLDAIQALATEAFVETVVTARQATKLEAILSGQVEIPVGGTVRATGIDRIMRDIAIERIKVRCAEFKKPMPKGDALAELVAKMVAKYDADIRAEAERRIEFAADVAETARSSVNADPFADLAA